MNHALLALASILILAPLGCGSVPLWSLLRLGSVDYVQGGNVGVGGAAAVRVSRGS
jgi:hypothetical protein